MSELHDPLANFTGLIRLFPLPNLVLFPHVLQPLHVFEPRYRQMTRDALDSDRLIALAVLQPDEKEEDLDKPPIFEIICLCKIVADQTLEDGRFNLLVRGLARAKILHEVESDKLYRQARVELVQEIPLKNPLMAVPFRRKFQKLIPHWFPDQPAVQAEFNKLLTSDLSLGMLCDIISFALPLAVDLKQELLAEPDVECRAAVLLKRLAARKERKFPPDFSSN